jgi:16S rRNA (adenine1518-N6/adenine1519-N6)-dimethyltransferase
VAIRPRKQFGQHWLRSEKVLNRIVAAADLQPSDRILEIGPGLGVLTQRLLPVVASVLAVEIDRDLCAALAQKFGHHPNLTLLEADFLAVDLPNWLQDKPHLSYPNKVVANIPYNITSPILEKLLGTITRPHSLPMERLVLLVQKEVADRLAAQPGRKAYGALSIKIQYLARCELICTVPPSAFHPPPKVDSAVICLYPQPPSQPIQDAQRLETLLQLGFASRRKMLRNNLKGLIDPAQLTHFLEQLSVSPTARAEELSLAQWIALSRQFPAINPGFVSDE